MRFKPGERPVGRAKGTPNKKTKNYLDFQLWFGLIKDKMESLTEKEQIEIAFRVTSMLLPKVNNLPTTPTESLENAMARQEELKALEKAEKENAINS